MRNVVSLDRMPANSFVLRSLPRLSPDAMRFMLALLTFRSLTGRTGIVRMSEVIEEYGIAPTSAIINELFDAGVMGQRDDGVVIYHPAVIEMMAPKRTTDPNAMPRSNTIVALAAKRRAQSGRG